MRKFVIAAPVSANSGPCVSAWYPGSTILALEYVRASHGNNNVAAPHLFEPAGVTACRNQHSTFRADHSIIGSPACGESTI